MNLPPSAEVPVDDISRLLSDVDPPSIEITREIIAELLRSRSADSSFWRYPLRGALLALNDAEVQSLVTPTPVKRQGQAYTLKPYKGFAVEWAYFFVGKGFKKRRALEKVAEQIGQSVETLRSWEKNLKKDPDYTFDFQSAEIAGRYEERFQNTGFITLAEEVGDDSRDWVPYFDRAHAFLRRAERISLDKLHEMFREARTAGLDGTGTTGSDT